VPAALAKQQCSATKPANGTWWSWRLIDGRKCWYEGKPGLSKALLEWPAQPESKQAKAHPESDQAKAQPETKQAKAQPESKQAKAQPESKQAKAQPESSQTKAQPESNQAKAQSESNKERASKLTDRPHNPLDSQARALTDSDTFETRWRSRVVQQHPIDPTNPEK